MGLYWSIILIKLSTIPILRIPYDLLWDLYIFLSRNAPPQSTKRNFPKYFFYYCWNMNFDSWWAFAAFARYKLVILPAWLLSLPPSTLSPFPSCSSSGLILIRGNGFALLYCQDCVGFFIYYSGTLVGTSLLEKGRNVLES
jgi:hypothetical protein